MLETRNTDYKKAPNVPLKSPLAIGGFFLHYLRIRYQEPWGAPWVYRESDTETELFIIAGNTIENEIRNNRPAIYVNVGNASVGNIVTGDDANTYFLKEKKLSYNRVNLGVTIHCESPNKGEAHQLGWFTFTSLISGQDVLRTKYHIANMGPYELSPPRPNKKDRETWISSINLNLTYELTWNVTAVQTQLRELGFDLDLQADRDPTSFLTSIYLQNLGDTTGVTI